MDAIIDEPQAPHRRNPSTRTLLVSAVVALPVIFSAVTLRGEVDNVAPLNDLGLHSALVRSAGRALSAHRDPLSTWFPYLNLGYPQLHHYPALAHLIAAFAGQYFDPNAVVRWTLFALLVTWPISVFWGARLLRLSRTAAVTAALLSPLVVSKPGYGFEWGSYVWRGYGLWPQGWAMWLLPIAVGLGSQFIRERRHPIAAPLFLGACIACHYQTGYMAVVLLGAIAISQWGSLLRRVARSLWMALAGLALFSPVVPALIGAASAIDTGYERHSFWYDSFGAPKILGWLVTGRLFDQGRLPSITVLLFIGLVMAILRFRDSTTRAILFGFVAAMVIFWGRATLGPIADLLPAGHDLFFHRFIIGVHFTGLLLAGLGAEALVKMASRIPENPVLGRLGVLGVAPCVVAVISVPGFVERNSYAADGRRFQHDQVTLGAPRNADIQTLLAVVRIKADGRVYAGASNNWGHENRVWYVQIYAAALNAETDSVGYLFRVGSLGTTFDFYLNENSAVSYDALGIRYALLPPDRRPPPGSSVVAQRGSDTLWAIPGTGYFTVVDTVGVETTQKNKLGAAMAARIANPPSVWPALALPDAPTPTPSQPAGSSPKGQPGQVVSQSNSIDLGVFIGSVQLERPATVVLRSSYHSGWQAFVDGRPAPVFAVAPGYVGVNVAQGSHVVSFRFQLHQNRWWYVVSLGTLVLLVVIALRQKLRPRLAIASEGIEGAPEPAHEVADVVDTTAVEQPPQDG